VPSFDALRMECGGERRPLDDGAVFGAADGCGGSSTRYARLRTTGAGVDDAHLQDREPEEAGAHHGATMADAAEAERSDGGYGGEDEVARATREFLREMMRKFGGDEVALRERESESRVREGTEAVLTFEMIVSLRLGYVGPTRVLDCPMSNLTRSVITACPISHAPLTRC
jgi:hypothetical protein